MIDTRINTFLTLVRVKNYRKTAELLNMTQPCVTHHIQYLENYYNVKLFMYDKKTLKLTEEAVKLEKYAQNVLYQEKKLKEELIKDTKTSLVIGATKTIGDFVIAEHISNFLKNPQNEISVIVDNTKILLEKLSKGQLDFALIEGFFDTKKYKYKLYKKEPFICICRKQHPLCNKTISLDHILQQRILLREPGSGTREITQKFLSEYNKSIDDFASITTISNFNLIARLLENDDFITFAYRSVCESNENLGEIYIEGFNAIRAFHYVYLDNSYEQDYVTYFDFYKKP